MVGGPARETVSACLIVRDEEQRLPAALASVAFCNEIVVVDSGSRDRTVELARAAGATVVENPWPGFGAQRNVAIDNATGEWVLEVDADERVSTALQEEIERFLAMPPPADVHCCVLPLRHRFLGGWLGPSGKYPAYRVRLFRRGSYRHDEARLVHEGLWPRERTWAMAGDLEHELAGSWSEALGDVWNYARLESGHVRRPEGAAGVLRSVVLRPAAKVTYRLVVDGGWRDGWRGPVKILLDATTDSMIFWRAAVGLAPARDGQPDHHFGRLVLRTGPVRVAAVAHRAGDVARAMRWLREARAAGADVALVTAADVDGGDWLHVQRLDRRGPLAVLRAFDAIGQMRPVDRLVLAGATAHWLPRMLSETTRGVLPPVDFGADPRDVVQRTLQETGRPSSG
jgi:glycosyltransferase involved in cell wall biosynthesis